MRDITAFLEQAGEQDLRLLRAALDEKLLRRGGTMRVLSRSFQVPAETKYLDNLQLEQATRAFSMWYNSARTPAHRRSRGRVWLAFLLIRYGALRLGEALALDDSTDIDPGSLSVFVKGSAERRVQLPPDVMEDIMDILESPMFFSIRGQALQLDQGYLRRKFYERARESNLPRGLLNPRALRHSRGIELLRGGVPMPVVQSFMGQANLNLTANYLEFSDETSERIVHEFLTKEVHMKTSARNAFTGKVTHIKKDGLLVEVSLKTMGGLEVVSVITEESFKLLAFAEGSVAVATVKAPWVILTEKEEGLKTSARNAFMGTVATVKNSEIAAEVVVDLPDGTKVVALVTNESVKKLDLKPGRDIMVMFKAFSVILNAE